MSITQQTFENLAFPVARVRYRWDSGRWVASIRRDSERTYHTRVLYDHATGGGARGALPAAQKALAKALEDLGAALDGATVDDYVAIPGDLDADSYVFTFVPTYILNGDR